MFFYVHSPVHNMEGDDAGMWNGTRGQPDNDSFDADNLKITASPALSGFQAFSVYGQGVFILLYSTVVIVSVGGNSLVILSIVCIERMRTVTNFFILNLACADLMMAVFCIPFTFVASVVVQYWPFSRAMCPIVTYAQTVTVFLSAFTLVAISLDRHRAIQHPLLPRLTCRRLGMIIAFIWAVSLLLPVPIAILSEVRTLIDSNGLKKDRCEETWPDENLRYGYTILIMVCQYFLPLCVLILAYIRISYTIWLKKTPGEPENNRDQRIGASKQKASIVV